MEEPKTRDRKTENCNKFKIDISVHKMHAAWKKVPYTDWLKLVAAQAGSVKLLFLELT